MSTSKPRSTVSIIKNREIRFPTVRVVYENAETGERIWKILPRSEALQLAADRKLDLVLVNGKADPPVCKLEKYGQLLMEKRKKAKEIKSNMKSRSLKEIFINADIDPHDLNTKLAKVKEFLTDSHPVKIAIIGKKNTIKRNPLAVEETTLRVLEAIENQQVAIQQNDNSTPFRKDFVVTASAGFVGSSNSSQ